MKTEITSEEYINIYQACGWDPKAFSIVLKRFGYSDELIVNGNLDVEEPQITSLVNITEVRGCLDLRYTSIQDLGKLKYVDGYLSLRYTPIQFLGNLEKVMSSLDLSWTSIQDLGNLEYVGSNLWLENTPISKKYSEKEIREMIKVDDTIWLV